MGKKSELEKETVESVVESVVEQVVEPVVEPVVSIKIKKPRTVKQLAADEKLRQRAKDLREFKNAKDAEKLAVTTYPHQAPPKPVPAPAPPKPAPAPAPAPKKKATPAPAPTPYETFNDHEDLPPQPKAKHFRLPRKYRIKS